MACASAAMRVRLISCRSDPPFSVKGEPCRTRCGELRSKTTLAVFTCKFLCVISGRNVLGQLTSAILGMDISAPETIIFG